MDFKLEPFFPGNMNPPLTPHAAMGGFPCAGPFLDAVLGGNPPLQGVGWFRRLPPRIREACIASRAYNKRKGIKVPVPFGLASQEAEYPYQAEQAGKDLVDLGWYDEEGYELDPNTRRRLSPAALLKLTGAKAFGLPLMDTADVEDYDGEIPDPETWEPAGARLRKEGSQPMDRSQAEAEIHRRGRMAVGSLLGMKISDVDRPSGLEYMIDRLLFISSEGYTLDEWTALADD